MDRSSLIFAYLALNQYLMLFDTQPWDVSHALNPYTNIDGSFFGFSLVVIKRAISIVRGIYRCGSSLVCTPGPPLTHFLNDVHRIRRGRGTRGVN